MKNIKRQIIVNFLIIVVAVVLFTGVSYSIDEQPTEDSKNLLIATGNMQVVLNIPNEKYEIIESGGSLTDKDGLSQKGYTFTIKNTGNIPIEYYEIRLVDQEGKISTLPHKYIKFVINKNDGEYEKIKNLGDNDSIIYSDYDLGIGKSCTYNLKMWVDDVEIDANGKSLYGAIEVTLYQKFDVYKDYVLYDSVDSTNVPIRTSIYSPISGTIPIRNGYKFVGWERKGRVDKYEPLDTYTENVGTTLYAMWEKE